MKEDKVLYQIKSLDKMIARDFCNHNKEGFECDLHLKRPTPTQLQIIDYILEHEGEVIYQKDLEEVLKLRRATVSGVLQTMEKNKLIVRKVCEDDTRVKKIILNEKTMEIHKNNVKRFKELEKVVTKDIPQEDIDTFLRVIKKMKNNLEDISANNED